MRLASHARKPVALPSSSRFEKGIEKSEQARNSLKKTRKEDGHPKEQRK